MVLTPQRCDVIYGAECTKERDKKVKKNEGNLEAARRM
jgi:hypothetical protein